MSSREAILHRIRERISSGPAATLPEKPEVWSRATDDPDALILRFTNELEALSGEVIRCSSLEDAQAKLVELVDGGEWPSIAAADRAAVREVVGGLDAARVVYPEEGFDHARLAEIPAAVINAELLLADTGSCVVEVPTTVERLMLYLPETSIIVARREQMREHLPAAWEEIAPRITAESFSGELVIVSGPSRTADIEKILILGVHGPKRLVVFVVD